MKHEMQLHYPFLLVLLLNFPAFRFSKSVIEPCNASDPCTSFLSYRLPWDSKLSEIADRFKLNVSVILASNSMDLTKPSLYDQILPRKSVVKLSISCPCIDGIRRSLSTTYSVQPADTLNSISEGFGALVSAEQIEIANGISHENPITNGQSLVIPLPCTCFNNSNYGLAVMYMSYVVQKGENLSSIASVYGTTISNLETVNGLGQPQIDPGDILAIPLPACSSADLNWHNESLIVPKGSYALTANGCIKCSCRPSYLNLQCSPSGLAASCSSHLQCKGSNLFIGDIVESQTTHGCNATECVYRGHIGWKIHRSLVNSTTVQCIGNQSHARASASTPPSKIPFSSCPAPPPSPFSASNEPAGIFPANHPARTEMARSCTDKNLTSDASVFYLLLLEIAILHFHYFENHLSF